MRIVLPRYFFALALIGLLLPACSHIHAVDSTLKQAQYFDLIKLFPHAENTSVILDANIIASPLLDSTNGQQSIIAPVSDGTIISLDSESGALIWQIKVPTPNNQKAQLIATPVITDNKLIVLYQCLDKGIRTSHRLAVIDLVKKQIDPDFPILTLRAEQTTVDGTAKVVFNPKNAYSHAALKHLKRNHSGHGSVYAAFGNAGDIQPFHGWVFEIDLDTWRHNPNQAIKSVLLTTPEADCPVTMKYGTQEMICGGGVWGPAGPLLVQEDEHAELFIPTGNGQIDLARHDYANALLRITPGLPFDDGCDAVLCRNFNPLNPEPACLSSCKNLFIPRLADNNTPIKPPFHECDDKGFWECLAWMDYDLGANSPVKIKLQTNLSVLVQSGKDGGVYLIDAAHLGTQYDRLQIAPLCGAPNDRCRLSWAGMIVTQPEQTIIDHEPVVIIPTFSPDNTHVAGVVALKIVLQNGKPKFKPFWQFPNANHPNALQMFRSHPSLPLLTTHLGDLREAIIWLVDIGAQGTLYGIRAKDGSVVAQQKLQGSGRQLSKPLIIGNIVYLSSVMPETGKSMIEAYRIKTREE